MNSSEIKFGEGYKFYVMSRLLKIKITKDLSEKLRAIIREKEDHIFKKTNGEFFFTEITIGKKNICVYSAIRESGNQEEELIRKAIGYFDEVLQYSEEKMSEHLAKDKRELNAGR